MQDEQIIEYFQTLTRKQQRELITKLGKYIKAIPASIRLEKSVAEVGLALKACASCSVKPEVKIAGKDHIRMLFDDMATRNRVWMSMMIQAGRETHQDESKTIVQTQKQEAVLS